MRKRLYLPLTRKRAAALSLFRDGALPLERFAERMWGRKTAPKFALHFLDGLEKLGLVGHNGDVFRITDEGSRLLAQTPWECAYCGATAWDPGTELSLQGCRTCGAEHRACRKCVRRLLVVEGVFPSYRPALKGCPKGSPART